jgi:hypothetical protein
LRFYNGQRTRDARKDHHMLSVESPIDERRSSHGHDDVSAPRHRPPSSSVRYVDRKCDLTALFDPGINVAVYQRSSCAALLADARRVAAMLNSSRLMLSISPTAAGRRQIGERLATVPTLAADVACSIELLADLTGAELIGVRLAQLDAPMCPRLHVDRVILRLVTTYLGEGTEYVASEHVDRAWLGHAAKGAPDEVSGVLRPGASIERAGQGHVVLLKGEAWRGNEGRGAVHRSPWASALAPRVVLTLDAL